MIKFTSLFAVTLLLANSPAWAEADRSADLRYCLDMQSNDAIAKCAGELSPGNKGKPLSKQEAEKILQKEKTSAPVNADKPSTTSATANDKPGNDLPPGKTESNSN